MKSDLNITALESQSSVNAIADYIQLLKPRVTTLVVITGAAGLITANTAMPIAQAAGAICAIALGSGAAGALNMWYDRDIDALMDRTCYRPIPAGRIDPDDALGFSILLAGLSIALMVVSAGVLPAVLLVGSILFYGVVYTMYLKRRTDQNIVIGGAAGALPPVIGWAAATGDISPIALVLFAIILVWTPPHFWALSLWTHQNYARAGVPMLPVTRGVGITRLSILAYTAVLAPLGVVPALIGAAGPLYLVVSTVAGAWFMLTTVRLWRSRAGESGSPADIRYARTVFAASILYLAALFIALPLETLLS